MARKKRKGFMTAFSIIFILIFVLGLFTHILPQAEFVDGVIVNGSGVVGAKLSDILLSPILGFENAVDVCIFILILGGFLAIVARSQALETGIQVLVKKLKGNELALIPILMFIFSIAGTTYGMLEETVGFYAILAAAMVMAGLMANGTTEVTELKYIDRGYEDLEAKLTALGADIVRIEDKNPTTIQKAN